jgi:UDP-glucuronate decarboxylase
MEGMVKRLRIDSKSIMPNAIVSQDLEYIHNSVNPGDRFRGATIVVTGCAGFLGFYFLQYLVLYASRLGLKKVIGLDTFLLRTPAWVEDLRRTHPDTLEIHQFDVAINSLSVIEGAKEARYVIHMASIASPSFYRQYPVETIDANIVGLRDILGLYIDSPNLGGILYFSSSEIYGDPDSAHIPTDEEYRGNVTCTGPRACYDEAKRLGETLCYVFGTKYSMPVCVARPFNNFGPGMRIDDKRLPADFALAVLQGHDITILSDGSPTRTFCYISDAIIGYLLCLLHGKYEYFNIGMDKPEISVREFADIYVEAGREIVGYAGQAVFGTSAEPDYLKDNPNRRCPNIDKARRILGYRPTISVNEGVRRFLTFLNENNI